MLSLRWRLALLFLAILLAALAVIYLYVVPQLESSLRAEKERALVAESRVYSRPIVRDVVFYADARHVRAVVRQAADRSGSRVTLLGVSRGTLGRQTYPIADSTTEKGVADLQFQVAQAAAQTGHTTSGSEPTNKGRIAEVCAADSHRRQGHSRRRVLDLACGRAEHGRAHPPPRAHRRRHRPGHRRARRLPGRAGAGAPGQAPRAGGRASGRRATSRTRSRSTPSDEIGELALAFNDMQRQLAQLDSARKRFIATASHELRTPILSLGGFVELLQDEELEEEERRAFLAQISEQVARLRNLSVDLLDLSKLEAGSLELHPEPTDLGAAGQVGLSRVHARRLAGTAPRLDVRLTGRGLEAACDPDRVAQIVRILLDNALTHTPQGTRIVVAAAREDGHAPAHGAATTGRASSAAALAHVFEPFYTSDDVQGSGLGLAIARELAERMDGRLAVESAPGRTTFTLELPA